MLYPSSTPVHAMHDETKLLTDHTSAERSDYMSCVPLDDYSVEERLQDLRESRSATFAIIHKVKRMRGAGDTPRVPYSSGPICPYYSADDLARYESELAWLDGQIAALSASAET